MSNNTKTDKYITITLPVFFYESEENKFKVIGNKVLTCIFGHNRGIFVTKQTGTPF
jgi:hypothetical protein